MHYAGHISPAFKLYGQAVPAVSKGDYRLLQVVHIAVYHVVKPILYALVAVAYLPPYIHKLGACVIRDAVFANYAFIYFVFKLFKHI